MKKVFYAAIVTIIAWTFAGCKPKEPTDPDNAFPKKNLIEEFTGQACGYCPFGMDCIHEFIGNDANWIVILHHYGYKADNFTVSGSATVSNALKVDGAPSMAVNRATTDYKEDKTVIFHPAYLEEVARSQFATRTYASVNINNSYNADTKELNVHVSGEVAKNDHPTLYLTVLVTESGMVDTQADYYNTFEGWSEFRHTNAVRAFLTKAKGEQINISNGKYEADYQLNIKDAWVPENCMVVAFLTEDFNPVIQVEQSPIVKGSTGGADIQHGGITAVPVADYYPEPDATKGPSNYSGLEADTLTVSQAYYKQYPDYGVTEWLIQTYNKSVSVKVSATTCIPFAQIYFYTDVNGDVTTVPTGTFPFTNTYLPETAEAGYRNDTAVATGGSMFYYINKSYFSLGYLVPVVQWLITNGELTIGTNSWSIVGHTKNGSSIRLVGKGKIQNKGKINAPARIPSRSELKGHIPELCK